MSTVTFFFAVPDNIACCRTCKAFIKFIPQFEDCRMNGEYKIVYTCEHDSVDLDTVHNYVKPFIAVRIQSREVIHDSR